MKRFLFAIIAVLMMSGLAFSQMNIGLNGVGGKIGYIMPEDPIDNTLGFGAAFDLGTITPTIHLNGFCEYWSKGYDVLGVDVSFSEFIFGATAKYYFSANGQLKPYAGGGLAFILGKASVDDNIYGVDVSESETDIGFHFCGGADYPLSPTLDGFAEIKYTLDGIDHLGIFVGVIYKMDK